MLFSNNSRSLWHFCHDLLSHFSPLAQFDGSSTLGRCDQEDGAPSALDSQWRDMYLFRMCRSPAFLISSKSELKRLNFWWVWSRSWISFFISVTTHRKETLFQVQNLGSTGALISLTPASLQGRDSMQEEEGWEMRDHCPSEHPG